MASNVLEKNGNLLPTPETLGTDVKILLVGEPKCGKSSFIEVFHREYGTGPYYADTGARVYPCRYPIMREMNDIKIFKIIGGPDDIVEELTGAHTDTNGFLFMYAVDDPSGYQKVMEKWYPILHKGDMWQKEEPAIVVGTKKDLRDNPQVLQRLARDNLVPVTPEQGESLTGHDIEIRKYFDCSFREPDTVKEAMHFILALALNHLNVDRYGDASDQETSSSSS